MGNIEFIKSYSAFVGNIGQTTSLKPNPGRAPEAEKDGGFISLLAEELAQKQELNFSKHALKRIESRQIPITPQLIDKLSSAVQKARGKGIKDALMISAQAAFIVNIPNSTVVTTISGNEMKENIFTNIDGAVIL